MIYDIKMNKAGDGRVREADVRDVRDVYGSSGFGTEVLLCSLKVFYFDLLSYLFTHVTVFSVNII